MTSKAESDFLEFLKTSAQLTGEEVYKDPADAPEPSTEAVVFSDDVQEASREGKEDVTKRLLPLASKSNSTQSAIMGAVLNLKGKVENSSPQIATSEKVSHPRVQSLRDEVLTKLKME